MKREVLIALFFLGCLCGTVLGEIKLPRDWQLPSGGYQAVYDADDGVFPTGNSGENKPVFIDSATAYNTMPPLEAPYAEMTKDDVTGENVLHIVNSPTIGPLYRLFRGAGVGAAEDMITLDMRLRLTEKVASNHQLLISIWRPAAESKQAQGIREVQYVLRFGTATFTQLGKDWHDLRFHIDVANRKVSLYMDGGIRPISSVGITINEGRNTRNGFEFGDGGGAGGVGSVNIAYIAWTNAELAPIAK